MRQLFAQGMAGCSQDHVCLTKWVLPVEIPEDHSISDVAIVIELPEAMTEMPVERQEAYYPYATKPDVILSDREESIQATIQMTGQDLKPAETYQAAIQIKEQLDSDYPGNRQSPVFLHQLGQIKVGWILMEMEERDWEHIKAVFSVGKKLILMTFTYRMEEKEKWRPVFKHILSSIHVSKDSLIKYQANMEAIHEQS